MSAAYFVGICMEWYFPIMWLKEFVNEEIWPQGDENKEQGVTKNFPCSHVVIIWHTLAEISST